MFTSSHLHLLSSPHLLILTSSHLHIHSFLHPHIFTCSPRLLLFALLPSCSLALLPSCPLLLLNFSIEGAGQCQRDGTIRNPVSESGPPQQSLADVLRNLLRNQSEPLESSTDTTTRGGPEIWTFQPRKAQKADPRNKASQTFCGTFSGTKVNPWNHPQILRPAGVRNLDLSAPKSSKSGPPQQSLADVLRNLLRNQSEPLESSTDTTTRGGPEFGPFSPEKTQKADPRK